VAEWSQGMKEVAMIGAGWAQAGQVAPVSNIVAGGRAWCRRWGDAWGAWLLFVLSCHPVAIISYLATAGGMGVTVQRSETIRC
jgi:hypothetical protein